MCKCENALTLTQLQSANPDSKISSALAGKASALVTTYFSVSGACLKFSDCIFYVSFWYFFFFSYVRIWNIVYIYLSFDMLLGLIKLKLEWLISFSLSFTPQHRLVAEKMEERKNKENKKV